MNEEQFKSYVIQSLDNRDKHIRELQDKIRELEKKIHQLENPLPTFEEACQKQSELMQRAASDAVMAEKRAYGKLAWGG